MAKIGNIYTSRKNPKFNELYNVIHSMDDAINGIPTLIIGRKNAQKCIPNYSILKKEYNNGMLFWTYEEMDSRADYEDDLQSFYDHCYNSFYGSVRYDYVDFINYGYTRLKKMINYFLHGTDERWCFLTRESHFLFIYAPKYKVVYGISLTLCGYIGIDKEKVKKQIRSNKANRFVYDTKFIDNSLRKVIGNKTHYIPIAASVLEK